VQRIVLTQDDRARMPVAAGDGREATSVMLRMQESATTAAAGSVVWSA